MSQKIPILEEIPAYYRYIRPEIITVIPSDVIKILDVGCAAGVTGKFLKEQNPRRKVVGIEINEEAFYYANQYLDLAFNDDVESFEPPFQKGEFDGIIFADVLEHLKDPWRIAKRYATFLKPGGVMVASIPNIRHLPTLTKVLEQGIWQYEEVGILDRTHLRFFTKKTFLELLKQANIVCQSITYLGGEAGYKIPFLENNRIIKQGELALINVSDRDFYELCAYQFVFVGIYQPEAQQSSLETANKIIIDIETPYEASVIVPWWDHPELLELWERNLENLSDAEIIFIDNGSQPEGQAALAKFCRRHQIKLIRNEENRGYAAANNQGGKIAAGEYLLFFNNDLEILSPLVKLMCHLAGEGISGPGPFRSETNESLVEGWALCIKKTTWEAIGKWCEDYGPGYWDDVDLCYRAKLAGYPLKYVPGLVADNWISRKGKNNPDELILLRHIGFTTSRDGRIDQLALNEHNRQLFTAKFYPYLRDVNLIILPDWHQPEDSLALELEAVIRSIVSHSDRQHLCLVIDTSNIEQEDADLLVSGLIMNILMEEDLEVTDEASIFTLPKSSEIEWLPILSRLHGRIILAQENQLALINSGVNQLKSYSLDNVKNKRVVKIEGSYWALT